MVMDDDTESCSSRPVDTTSKQPRFHRQKLEVYNEVLGRLQELNCPEAVVPGFDDQLWLHFHRLPARYALDVNVERAEDVLMHKRLLSAAEHPATRPVFEVRPVQVQHASFEHLVDLACLDSSERDDAQSVASSARQSFHPPPTFGSSSNLDALAQAHRPYSEDGDANSHADSNTVFPRPMHEITFSTVDRPKLLSQLTSLLAEIGLNIQEAHAFSTVDGFSLDVFVVDGWGKDDTGELKNALKKELLKTKDQLGLKHHVPSTHCEQSHTALESISDFVDIPNDGTDVWEIDSSQLKIQNKVASGSFGDLYKGMYYSQEVAVKILKPERVNVDMLKEFSQEVYIMRKVRHKNVVQFIGACTRPPNLCIVTEFMSKGSVYDYLHKQKGVFKLPSLLKVAVDVSKGMNYLHQNSIIHRDLKTANLLMDENGVIKVADFGVARVQTQSGVMTAETGTYRWMAPEVSSLPNIKHK